MRVSLISLVIFVQIEIDIALSSRGPFIYTRMNHTNIFDYGDSARQNLRFECNRNLSVLTIEIVCGT